MADSSGSQDQSQTTNNNNLAYSSYGGSYDTSPYSSIPYAGPTYAGANPYGATYPGYNPYPMSSSTTSLGTAYGDGKGALTQAEALNERSGGDQLHVYKDQAKFDNDKQHQNEGIEIAQTAGAVGLVAMAGGIAAGSIRSTKMDKNGKPVTNDGEVVKKTSKTKYGVIAGLAGLGAGAVYSVLNR